MSIADRLLEGAMDIHVHCSPDPRVERRGSAIDFAMQAREMGMLGMVIKSHEYPTHPVAYTASQAVPGVTLLGGVSLDVEVGGLNPTAVESTARIGGRVVWMPTFSARADRQLKGLTGGIYLLGQDGSLVPELYPILELIKANDMVLATGHISTQESMVLVSEARSLGISRIVVTHGTTMTYMTGMTLEDMQTLAAMGAYIEHCTHVMMPLTRRMAPRRPGVHNHGHWTAKLHRVHRLWSGLPSQPRRGTAHGYRDYAPSRDGRSGSWHAGQGQPVPVAGVVTADQPAACRRESLPDNVHRGIVPQNFVLGD